jgi:hypothetical protein
VGWRPGAAYLGITYELAVQLHVQLTQAVQLSHRAPTQHVVRCSAVDWLQKLLHLLHWTTHTACFTVALSNWLPDAPAAAAATTVFGLQSCRRGCSTWRRSTAG